MTENCSILEGDEREECLPGTHNQDEGRRKFKVPPKQGMETREKVGSETEGQSNRSTHTQRDGENTTETGNKEGRGSCPVRVGSIEGEGTGREKA